MHAPSETAAFDEPGFETRLESLKDTQDGIQLMSAWCLQHRSHHRRIVSCWLNVFKRARVEHRLVLFYLANDVIQHSKRKRYDFVDSWATALQRATTMVRDDKVKSKILRIFGIWEQRDIFSEDYLNDLRGLLNSAPPAKRTHSASATAASSSSTTSPSVSKGAAESLPADDFQAASLITHVRDCVQLSEATDRSFRKLPKAPPYDLDNVQSVKAYLKDKTHSEEVKNEFERHSSYLETYTQSLQAEIGSRKLVLGQLERAIKFYGVQRGEVKVIVNAYKNFGARIKMVKKKLDEISPSLPSPIPSPDVNAPSPEPDADLALPDDKGPDLNMVFGQMNGFTGYLGSSGKGMLPFDINDFKSSSGRSSSHPIEVIGSRSDDESYPGGSSGGDYYKPEPLSPFPRSSSAGTPLIPGLSPMPVPPVNDGYSSLARSSQQYAGILPPPQTGPLFGTPYTPAPVAGSVGGGYQPQPIMPPPPMPPLGLESSASDDYNSSWTDMSMSWSQLNTSAGSSAGGYASGGGGGNGGGVVAAAETPVSPPHFERESSAGPREYREHGGGSGMGSSAEDVDHRQLGQRPPFSIGNKLGLSKEKSRQLDIRNLISLTDSPGANDSEKNVSWLSVQSVDFRSNHTGDVDYRSSASVLRTIETTHKGNATSSPLKTPDSHKDMDSGVRAVAKSNDMVVDMDMSDEDVDELYRDQSVTDVSGTSLDVSGGVKTPGVAVDPHTRPPLLDTPHEYDSAAGWPDMSQQQQQQQAAAVAQQQANLSPWSGPPPGIWNGGGVGGAIGGGVGPSGNGTNGLSVPPPPVVPQFAPYPPYAGGGEFNSPRAMGRGGGGVGCGRGRGGGWAGGPPGGGGGSHRGGNPFAGPRLNFNRGFRGGGIGGGAPSPGGMRGNYRGKFRGHNNAWI